MNDTGSGEPLILDIVELIFILNMHEIVTA